MNFAEAYELDKTVEAGVWRTLKSGLRVKVASLRSPAYRTAIRRLQKVYAAELRANDPVVITMITAKAMAEATLLDWDGATDLDGNPVPYSKEVGEDMLIKYEVFREEVSEVAVIDENYLVGEVAGK